jgi:protease-4
MSLETDLLLDRRRLKRRLFLWRGFAVLALLAAGLLALTNAHDSFTTREHVARVTITGLITEDRRVNEAIIAAGRDDSVRALIVAVDSPGGTVSGGESLHHAIAGVAAKKPVVAVLGGTAASAGYMIALPAGRILARDATLTGSIGVKLTVPEVSGLMERLGIASQSLVSGPLKDEPNFFQPMTPAGRAAMQAVVNDMYDQFVQMVAKGRAMPETRVRELADGRVWTGRQALALGLVDAIGGEAEARQWLAEARGVSLGLVIRDIDRRGLADRALGESVLGLLGAFGKSLLSQPLSLDSAWAVWHPSISGE